MSAAPAARHLPGQPRRRPCRHRGPRL